MSMGCTEPWTVYRASTELALLWNCFILVSNKIVQSVYRMKGVAVAGCGQWGKNLVRNFHSLGILCGVCDPDPDQAGAQVALYSCPAFSWEDLLQDQDVLGVALCVPAPFHASMAHQALDHGKHVFVEKPIAFSSKEVEELGKKANDHHLVFMGGHVLRYHPAFEIIQDLVCSGQLGEILFIDSYRQNFGRVVPAEKNVFWSLSPHDLSLILALTKELPTKVAVQADSFYTSADQGVVHMTFPNRCTARIMTSWISPLREQRLVVTGTQGSVVWHQGPGKHLTYYPVTLSSVEMQARGESKEIPYDLTEPLLKECSHFWNAICHGHDPLTNAMEGHAITWVLEQIEAQL